MNAHDMKTEWYSAPCFSSQILLIVCSPHLLPNLYSATLPLFIPLVSSVCSRHSLIRVNVIPAFYLAHNKLVSRMATMSLQHCCTAKQEIINHFFDTFLWDVPIGTSVQLPGTERLWRKMKVVEAMTESRAESSTDWLTDNLSLPTPSFSFTTLHVENSWEGLKV